MKKNIMRSAVCLCLAAMTVIAPMSATAASTAKIASITGSNVRMRNSSGVVIDKLARGEKVMCTGKSKGANDQVITTDGKYGYVYDGYLRQVGSVKKSQVYITNKKATTYSLSGRTFKKRGSLGKNKFVLVYKTNDGWVYAKTMAGKYVYLKKQDLSKVF